MLLHWKFDPVLLSLGPIAIHWYGLLFVGAFFTGQALLVRMFKAENVPPQKAEQLLLYALLGTIVGARLVHCFFYDPAYYLSNPLAILRIWEGGLASHGGALGMLLGLWLGNARSAPRLPFLWLVDRVAIPAALGAVFVRVANFLNSEILGKPTAGDWGVVFDSVDALPRHPVQLYEALGYLAVAAVLWSLYRREGRHPPPGRLLGWFMVLVFSLRIATEFFKAPQAAYEAGQVFSVGQYLSLPFVLLGVALMLRARKPGA
ncbi:prolipoprotein diacylglyceryl transferase [Azohydromonas caseinilytica]|uniref:Phosphatidylglycerol--prolipoprotein diacylglyceryl transferase n=1 Tax=Azohydromonas caseinilytica TaxID=2728836 RepID=A0A848FEX4_9BURK|nr:prolipoprotein diacylglyceryl transferase [Azohydromonas caseinilytica]NML16889.1 prolipoprotein diacylglyceryl transferase [Azohydromonas caseinilytica]